jgi:outer membrane protein OmpA-like peptidoglycan-associated protein
MVGDGMVNSGDAHLCNYAENAKFFLDPNCPYRFETIWDRASTIYHRLGAISHITPASKVKRPEVLMGMATEYKDVKDLSQVAFDPNKALKSLEATGNEILTKPVQLRFLPNSRTLDGSDLPAKDLVGYKADQEAFNQMQAENKAALESIVKLAGSAGNTLISIEGNVDQSKKAAFGSDEAVSRMIKELSYARADTVKRELAKMGINPSRMVAKGNGWDKIMPGAIDPNNKEHNRLNRRTDIVIKSFESE